MKRVVWTTAAGWLLAAALACSTPVGPGSSSGPASLQGYRVVRDVRLPGDTSRWDYQVYDPAQPEQDHADVRDGGHGGSRSPAPAG
jgi:hypothetical protein